MRKRYSALAIGLMMTAAQMSAFTYAAETVQTAEQQTELSIVQPAEQQAEQQTEKGTVQQAEQQTKKQENKVSGMITEITEDEIVIARMSSRKQSMEMPPEKPEGEKHEGEKPDGVSAASAAGEAPEKPEGESAVKASGEVPEKPEGESAEKASGEAPEKPEGESEEKASGEAPEKPEGESAENAVSEMPEKPEGDTQKTHTSRGKTVTVTLTEDTVFEDGAQELAAGDFITVSLNEDGTAAVVSVLTNKEMDAHETKDSRKDIMTDRLCTEVRSVYLFSGGETVQKNLC